MNFIKRAAWSLLARKGRSLIMLGLFTVISTLVLSGFLLQSAAAQSTANAKSQIGADATLQLDVQKLAQSGAFSGSLGAGQTLYTNEANKVGKSPLVQSFNYTVEESTHAKGLKPVVNVPAPANLPAELKDDSLPLTGTLDSSQMAEFKGGKYTIAGGRGIVAADAVRNVVLVEQRFAAKNHLKVGDKITLTATDPTTSSITLPFTVIGIFDNPAKSPTTWVMPQGEPGNQLYIPVDAAGRLDPGDLQNGAMRITAAVFTLKDPGTLSQLNAVAKAAGIDMNTFSLTLNDTTYQQLVGPIQNTSRFAGLGVWLVSIAGAVILGLLVAMAVKDRRKELGILLSLGERKWRLVAQQVVEIGAIALLALGFSVLAGQAISQQAGNALLSSQVASAAKNTAPAARPAPAGGGVAGAAGASADSAVQTVKPIDKIKVVMQAGDIGKLAGVGLGIGLAAVLIPGTSIVRTSPRTILAKGD